MKFQTKAYSFISWVALALLALALSSPATAQNGGVGKEQSVAQGGAPITFQYFYDDRGQLVKVVDSTGNVIEYVYDPAGNMLEIKRYTASGLAVFGFTPGRGPVGTSVTIQGQQFSAVPASNAVRFNGVAATVISATSTSLLVTVPLGASTGPVSVTVGGNTASSSTDFVVTHEPVVTSIDPTLLIAGTSGSIHVTGYNLTSSTFTFQPAYTPPHVGVGSAIIGASGLTATLSVGLHADALGGYILVATNSDGSSNGFASSANTLTVIHNLPGEVDSTLISIVNLGDPYAPENLPGEVNSTIISVQNQP